jgi:2-dehydro-3-deoxygluconokinase
VAEVPVPAIERVRDTTGAGDAFAAGYLGARLRGEEHPLMAVRHGHALAARVLHTAGASASDTATQ